MKLMIVDDHAGARQMIRKLLASPGVTVRECSSGHEAIQAAREFKPDWITMDVHMPGMDGLKAAAAIHAEHPATRIVIITGDDHSYLRPVAREAGAVAHICKEHLVELSQWLAQAVAAENSTDDDAGGGALPSGKGIEVL